MRDGTGDAFPAPEEFSARIPWRGNKRGLKDFCAKQKKTLVRTVQGEEGAGEKEPNRQLWWGGSWVGLHEGQVLKGALKDQ